MNSNSTKWYIVKTYGRSEEVKLNLEKKIETLDLQKKITSVIIPFETQEQIKRGSRKCVKKKIFSGYILVCITVDEREDGRYLIPDDIWSVIRGTEGVKGFIVDSNKYPRPLEKKEIDSIFERMNISDQNPKLLLNYIVGDFVKIIQGSCSGMEGIVKSIDIDSGCVKIDSDFCGKKIELSVKIEDVKKIWKIKL